MVLSAPAVLLALVPIWYVADSALDAGWHTIKRTVFRERVADLLGNTLQLCVLTMLACLVLGLATAWLVECTDLPLRRVWAVLFVVPLAIPAFVNSYAWISLTRSVSGLSGAVIVTALSYFPFVYLPASAALRRLDPTLEESGLSLGLGPVAVLWRVVLPQLRPALFGGALLVGLHALAEYGALSMLQFQTFTTAIVVQYQSDGEAAPMLAGVLVLLGLLFVTVEVLARGRRRYSRTGFGTARSRRETRLGVATLPVLTACVGLVALALGVPLYAVGKWLARDSGWEGSAVWDAVTSTLQLGVFGAVAAAVVAYPLAWAAVRGRGLVTTAAERLPYLTSALPGVVVALALVAAFADVDGLYQTTALTVAAYVMLFLPRALVNLRVAIAQSPPELEQAGRALGVSGLPLLRRVTLPLIAPGVGAALAFVFLAVCTELTATLLLAPTGTTTLATEFFTAADELDYSAAAPYAALMILVAAPVTYLLLRQHRRGHLP